MFDKLLIVIDDLSKIRHFPKDWRKIMHRYLCLEFWLQHSSCVVGLVVHLDSPVMYKSSGSCHGTNNKCIGVYEMSLASLMLKCLYCKFDFSSFIFHWQYEQQLTRCALFSHSFCVRYLCIENLCKFFKRVLSVTHLIKWPAWSGWHNSLLKIKEQNVNAWNGNLWNYIKSD